MPANPTVLIVEDNPDLVLGLAFEFSSAGFDPMVCSDGQTAWEVCRAQPDVISTVVTDHEMPKMTGLDLCRNINQSNDSIPLFFITGHPLELPISEFERERSQTQSIGKPFSPSSVIAAVREASQQRSDEPSQMFAS